MSAQSIGDVYKDASSTNPFATNWKMTVKTILIQSDQRLNADAESVSSCLGLQAGAKVKFAEIIKNIEANIPDFAP